ncbi:MAG: prenyltransferase/squalene oxidase repeat-containing protein [Planctomycetota bacterium]
MMGVRTAMVVLSVCGLAFAQPEPAPGPEAPVDGVAQAEQAGPEITPALQDAIDRGLEALAQMQNEEGAFPVDRFPRHVGITSIACLAFMADGSMPGRGRYGEAVERGLEFVLDNALETGLLAGESVSHGPMYGHGFATLFLGEVYGMTRGGGDDERSRRLHDALVRACRLIVESQNDEGGWRYNPTPADADISVTICQIMALRAARNAGIEVPKETIDRAVEYVRLCQADDGGFRYQLNRGGSAWPRSAAGVASLFYAGVYEGEEIDRGLEYLRVAALPGRTEGGRRGSHYFYGHYYAAQAMFLAGGEHWEEWWPAIRGELMDRQLEDGSWNDVYGGAYATGMSLIVLQMPNRYLPIFQK